MSHIKIFLSVILLLIFGNFKVSWGVSYPFELARPLYVGARALGMGNAFTAVADDATAGFWNPAGLIQWQGFKVFGVNKIYDRRDYAFDPKGIGYSYHGNAFFWGNKIALRVASGTPDFNYYSFARQVNAYVAVGVSLKFKRKHPANYYQFFGSDFSYDIALLSRLFSRIQIGVLMQNLPQKRAINPPKSPLCPPVYGGMKGGEKGGCPFSKVGIINLISLGLSYRLPAPHASRQAGRPKIMASTDFVFSMSEISESEIHIGAEWTFNKYLRFRAGISETHPTFGLGVVIRCVRLDYAWIREHGFYSHFVSAEFKG
jgi:hypothetical protein